MVYGYYTCDFVIANCNIFNDFCSLSNLAILLDFGLNCLSEECSAYNRVWLPFDRYDAVTYLKYLDTLRVQRVFDRFGYLLGQAIRYLTMQRSVFFIL